MIKIVVLPKKSESIKKREGELEELLANIGRIYKVRYFALALFNLIVLTVTFTGVYPINKYVLLIVFLLLPNAFIFDFLFRKTALRKTIRKASVTCLFLMVIEAIAMLACFHIDGTMMIVGLFGMTVYLLVPYFTFTRQTYRWFFIVIVMSCSAILINLEHFRILIPGDPKQLGLKNIADNYGLYLLNLTLGMAIMFTIIFFVDIFARRLQKSLKLVYQKEEELRESKSVLEIKVDARTRQLKEQANSLREENERKTQDLKDRINEMETFHRLTIGRELKMIELKEKIKELEKSK